MADNANGAATPSAEAETAQPSINVLAQYVKDLSFENPGAPNSLRASDAQPEIQINVGVGVKGLSDGNVEVELKLNASAKRGEETLFITELSYGGLFQLRGVGRDQAAPIAFIECPRLLFPFARQVVADAIQQGGFPPLLIQPVDFASLYRQQVAEANIRAQAAAAGSQSIA